MAAANKITLELSTGKKTYNSPAALADALYTIEQERLAQARKMKDLDSDQGVMEKWFVDNLEKSDATGIQGTVGAVRITSKTVPVVESAKTGGWAKLYKWIAKNNRFDMLQKRLNTKAIQEMWDNNKKVDGVTTFNAIGVSITKAK
jgi:hypothetical protein